MRRVRRSKSLALLFLLTAVVVGGGLGFTAERFVSHEGRAAGGRLSLYDELGLTDPQRARLDSILDEQRRQIDEVMRPVRPRLDSIRADARVQIRQALTPEQITRLEAINALAKAKHAARKDKDKTR